MASNQMEMDAALRSAQCRLHPLLQRGDPVFERAWRQTITALILANAAGAAITFTIGWLATPPQLISGPQVALLAVVVSVYLILTLGGGSIQARRTELGGMELLTAGAEVDDAGLRQVLGTAWVHTRRLALYWAGAAVLVAVTTAASGLPGDIVGRDVLTVVLGGLTTACLGFLLVERGRRPLIARVRERLPELSACAPSTRMRLLLAWALGSAIPLLGILDTLWDERDADRTRLLLLLGLIAVVGLGTGALTSFLAAGAVADPLRRLHRTMAAVGGGDYDISVPVEDSGEIGDLQVQFNSMTTGLRERERLRDLFGRHVGEAVARNALENTVLGGERREVSVLLLDIRGSTALAENLPPEQLVRMLNDVFGAAVRVVEEQGGWVNKFEGDAALCIFGAPVPLPGHAGHALAAARHLAGELRTLQTEHPELDFGIGVATGSVVAGNIGAQQRYEYTVIGDAVNVAARLCEVAKTLPGRIAVTEATVQAAPDPAWRAHGDVELRGRRQQVTAYTVGAHGQAAGEAPDASNGAAEQRTGCGCPGTLRENGREGVAPATTEE